MCSLEDLCSRSTSAFITTLPAAPQDQPPPRINDVTDANISLSWEEPRKTNGKIQRFEIELQRVCPHPHQPFDQKCSPDVPYIAYSGSGQQKNISHLRPYMRYKIRVVSINLHGRTSSQWISVITKKKNPLYKEMISVRSNVTKISVDWSESFQLNSILIRFDLYDREVKIYSGVENFFYIRRTAYMIYQLKVEVITNTGSAQTPIFNYDPRSSKLWIVDKESHDQIEGSSTVDVVTTLTERPFYEHLWFVAICSATVIVIAFTALALVFRRNKNEDHKPRVPLKISSSNLRKDQQFDSLPPYSPTIDSFAYREFLSHLTDDEETNVKKRYRTNTLDLSAPYNTTDWLSTSSNLPITQSNQDQATKKFVRARLIKRRNHLLSSVSSRVDGPHTLI